MERITLRLPEDLHKILKEMAEKQDRSLNAQIVHALKTYVQSSADNEPKQTER